MLVPSSERLEGKTDSLYALCVLAAKRARQLKDPMVRKLAEARSDHPLTVALEEIAQGAITARHVEKPVVDSQEFPAEGREEILAAAADEEVAAPSVHDLLRVGGDEEEEKDLEADETEEAEEGEEVKDLFEAIASGDVEPIVEEEEEEEEKAAATEEVEEGEEEEEVEQEPAAADESEEEAE